MFWVLIHVTGIWTEAEHLYFDYLNIIHGEEQRRKAIVGSATDLVFYACYFRCTQHMALCLTLTASSSADSLYPGLPTEEQNKLSSVPLHHNWSHEFVATVLCSDKVAPGFPIVSEQWQKREVRRWWLSTCGHKSIKSIIHKLHSIIT